MNILEITKFTLSDEKMVYMLERAHMIGHTTKNRN